MVGHSLRGPLIVDLNSKTSRQIAAGSASNELPSNTISSLLADDEGIWIGTPNGLVFTDDRALNTVISPLLIMACQATGSLVWDSQETGATGWAPDRG